MLLFIFVNDSFVVTLRFAFITIFARACANFCCCYQGHSLFCIRLLLFRLLIQLRFLFKIETIWQHNINDDDETENLY